MKYLLDTHILLWWLTEPKKINTKALKIISDHQNKIYISSASFWEMAIKQSLGRLTIPHNLIESLLGQGFSIIPISAEDGLAVADLPLIHTDPFDRLLIVQAKLHDFIIITKDKKISDYDVITLAA